MQKILIISNSTTYHTRPRGIQANHLINELSNYYDIYLITSKKSVPDGDISKYFNNKIKNILIIPGSHNKLISNIYKYITGLSKKDRLWYYKVRKYALKVCQVNEINTIVCLSGLFSNLDVGRYIKSQIKHVKLYSFLSDPIYLNGYSNNWRYKEYINRIYERRIFISSDMIIFPSKMMKAYYQNKYSIHYQKIQYIPHGYVCNNQTDNSITANEGNTVRYIGGLSEKRNPYALLEHVKNNIEFYKKKNIRFEFIGKIRPDVLKIIRNYNIPIVSTKGTVSYNKVQDYIRSSLALLVIDADIKNSLFLPSKLVEQLPYKIPIIGITPNGSESSRVLNETGHYVVNYDNIENMKSIIDMILKTDRIYSKEIEKYNIKNTAKMWQEIIDCDKSFPNYSSKL